MTEPANHTTAPTQIDAPKPTTKPGGSSFSTAAIVLAIVSLFIGGWILAGAAVGAGIRAKLLGQQRAVLSISLGAIAVVINGAVAIALELLQ